jgi:hypothetical protein
MKMYGGVRRWRWAVSCTTGTASLDTMAERKNPCPYQKLNHESSATCCQGDMAGSIVVNPQAPNCSISHNQMNTSINEGSMQNCNQECHMSQVPTPAFCAQLGHAFGSQSPSLLISYVHKTTSQCEGRDRLHVWNPKGMNRCQ